MSSDKPDVLKIIDKIHDLPTLPQVLVKLIALIGDERASGQQVGEMMVHDPVLAARVLRVVNSSFYAMSRKITSIRDAVVILGFSTVRSLVISASVLGYFKGHGFSHEKFWQHSLACASIADLLCRKSSVGKIEIGTGFTAALLHGIGKIIFEQHLNAEFVQVLNFAREHQTSFAHAEEELITGSSAELSYFLLQRWRLPEKLQDAVRYQNNPRLCQSPENSSLAVIIYLSRYLYRAQGEENGMDFDDLEELDEELWQYLSLPPLENIAEEISKCITEAKTSIENLF